MNDWNFENLIKKLIIMMISLFTIFSCFYNGWSLKMLFIFFLIILIVYYVFRVGLKDFIFSLLKNVVSLLLACACSLLILYILFKIGIWKI